MSPCHACLCRPLALWQDSCPPQWSARLDAPNLPSYRNVGSIINYIRRRPTAAAFSNSTCGRGRRPSESSSHSRPPLSFQPRDAKGIQQTQQPDNCEAVKSLFHCDRSWHRHAAHWHPRLGSAKALLRLLLQLFQARMSLVPSRSHDTLDTVCFRPPWATMRPRTKSISASSQ